MHNVFDRHFDRHKFTKCNESDSEDSNIIYLLCDVSPSLIVG
jgi:hypothetical protein